MNLQNCFYKCQEKNNCEQGSASISTALAIIAVIGISVLLVQYLSVPSRLAQTQNYADLSAISAAQLIQNGMQTDRVCVRVKEILRKDSQGKVQIVKCEIIGEIAHISTQYAKTLPFLMQNISAYARAGPVE